MNEGYSAGLKFGGDALDHRNLIMIRYNKSKKLEKAILTAPDRTLNPSVKSKALFAKNAFRADSPDTTMTVSWK